MARFRRESHHSDGITDQISLQRTSATKSAKSGLMHRSKKVYSITSSARPDTGSGMVIPSVLAVPIEY
jgi:hypothetical protein